MHFSFEKHVPSQVLKDFSVENLETTPSTSLSKFSFEVYLYLSRIIDYCGSIFTLHLTSGVFSLVCVLSVFFSFFLSFFLFFFLYRYFPWQILTIQRIVGKREGIIIICFPLPPAREHWFNSSKYLPLLFNRSICNYQTDSWWGLFSLDICILFAFLVMQLSRSYWLWHFKVALWGFELIWNHHLSITKPMP